jgi:arylsulfatase A-like enzyme
MIDTLRFDYLGCYGFRGGISPNVDALAREGHRFRRCYAQAPWTKPSIASLFCSQYPSTHGVAQPGVDRAPGDDDRPTQGSALSEDALTIAEVLRSRGYETAAFVTNPWVVADNGYDQGFDVFDDQSINAPADTILEASLRWLKDPGRSGSFFLYLHFMDVHGPYAAPDSCYEAIRYSPSAASDTVFAIEENFRELVAEELRTPDWVGEPWARLLSTWKARYGAGMKYLDDQLGPFLRELRESGVMDRAYIVVTSDHGEELFEHNGWTHGKTLYEEQVRVPLVIRPPGGLDEPRVHSHARLIDLAPTLVSWAGAEVPASFTGDDLGNILAGEGPQMNPPSFATAALRNPELYSMNSGELKMILDLEKEWFVFYNLAEDPRESKNARSSHRAQADWMYKELMRFAELNRKERLFRKRDQPISEAQLEQLRSLGYMN